MNTLPPELIVTYLAYCTDKIKVDFITSCQENSQYRYFFCIREVNIDKYKMFVNHDLVKKINRYGKMFDYFTLCKPHISVKTLKPGYACQKFPVKMSEVIFCNVLADDCANTLLNMPSTVKKIIYKGDNVGSIIYTLCYQTKLQIETLIIDNTDTRIYHSYMCSDTDVITFKKLKKLKTRNVFLDFFHYYGRFNIEFLSMTKHGNYKFDHIPSSLSVLHCDKIHHLFKNTDLSNTNLVSLQPGCWGLNYPPTLKKLSITSHTMTFPDTIQVLKLDMAGLLMSNINKLLKLKKLILHANTYKAFFYKKQEYVTILKRLIQEIKIVSFDIDNSDNEVTSPLDKILSIEYVTRAKFIDSHIVSLKINDIRFNELYIPNTVVILSINFMGCHCHVTFPDSLRSLTVMYNRNATYSNLPKKLVKLNYSSGTTIDVPAKYLFI